MERLVGIGVPLELTSLCVLDAAGKVVREAKIASEPEALVAFLRRLGLPVARIGLDAGPLSQWLYHGLREAGFDAVLLKTRHVEACGGRSRPVQSPSRSAPSSASRQGGISRAKPA